MGYRWSPPADAEADEEEWRLSFAPPPASWLAELAERERTGTAELDADLAEEEEGRDADEDEEEEDEFEAEVGTTPFTFCTSPLPPPQLYLCTIPVQVQDLFQRTVEEGVHFDNIVLEINALKSVLWCTVTCTLTTVLHVLRVLSGWAWYGPLLTVQGPSSGGCWRSA